MNQSIIRILKMRMVWVGVVLFAVGVALELYLVVQIIASVKDMQKFARTPIPGEVVMELDAQTTYTVYYEWKSIIDGQLYVASSTPPLLQIDVLDNGKEAAIFTATAITSTYEYGNYSGKALGTFQPRMSGEHQIVVSGTTGGVMAVGVDPWPMSRLLLSIFVGGCGGGIAFVGGIVLLVIAVIRNVLMASKEQAV